MLIVHSFMKTFFSYLMCLIFILACSQKSTFHDSKAYQDSMIKKYLVDGAWKFPLYSQDFQKAMDKAIEAEPNIAYFYQQKAMPLIKIGKNDLAKPLLDKAVELDEENYLDYRAFIKCIFFREYQNALKDLALCKAKYGNGYVMDHSYNFYIALCKLQLNQFAEAENILESQIEKDIAEHGEDWVHYAEYFYLGISLFEQKKFQEAIAVFDKALTAYLEFPDALFYKAKCYQYLGKTNLAETLFKQAQAFGKQGFSMNESNSQYIRYPYQIRW